MNDIDLAFSISKEIGTLYQEAKENSSDLPDYSLGRLRGLCHLICDLIAQDGRISFPGGGSLETKIHLLFKEHLIDRDTKANLHQLRVNGNSGAHPEQFNLTQQDFAKLAEQSLSIARILLGLTFRCLHPGAPVPDYKIAETGPGNLRNVCYRAMIEGDAEARHFAGKLFHSKAEELKKETERAAAESGNFAVLRPEYRSFLEQAFFWFKLGADSEYAPSMYEYGVALAEGFEGEEKKSLGESLVYKASRLGNADAHAFIGDCFLHGSRVFDIDPVEARNHFELAAAEDHPAALANLGAMYEKGVGGPANLKAAFDYTRRAAEAGYPQGQYNLFVLYWKARGVERDETEALEWLAKASEQGYPMAMLNLARLMVDGQIPGKGSEAAKQLYIHCLSHNQLGNEARYELALLYNAKGSCWEELIQAASLLQECFEKEGGETELASKCWQLAPSVVRKLRDGFVSIASDEALLQGAMIVLNYFDQDGHPYKSRKERNQDFLVKASKFKVAQNLGESQVDEAIAQFLPKGMPRSLPGKVIPLTRASEKIGRNDPCPCGSGKKFKVCCGR